MSNTTWQETLTKSAALFDRSSKSRKQASGLLWDGAQDAITEWVGNSDTDVHAEVLYADVLEVLGTERKGDVSKIKTVALAVRNNGLSLAAHDNLSKAYAEARRLTVTAQAEKAEDDAVDSAIESISAPKSTSSVDGAAALLLSKGADGAVVALLDALGATNFEAHRALVRAMTTEIAARVQAAKPKPVKKAAAKKATAKKVATPKATPKDGASKAKPVAKKTAAPKAQPVTSVSKGDPNKRPLPAKKTAAAPVEDPTPEGDDLFEEFGLDEDEVTPEETVTETPAPAKKTAARKGRPVRR